MEERAVAAGAQVVAEVAAVLEAHRVVEALEPVAVAVAEGQQVAAARVEVEPPPAEAGRGAPMYNGNGFNPYQQASQIVPTIPNVSG